MNITTAKKEKKEMGARNLLLLIFITFIALGNPILAQQANQEQAAVQAVDYKIGAKDLLEIKVFELPELNQTVRVAEDGTVIPRHLSRFFGWIGLGKTSQEASLAKYLAKMAGFRGRVAIGVTRPGSPLNRDINCDMMSR